VCCSGVGSVSTQPRFKSHPAPPGSYVSGGAGLAPSWGNRVAENGQMRKTAPMGVFGCTIDAAMMDGYPG
jgi:hypothetical protein